MLNQPLVDRSVFSQRRTKHADSVPRNEADLTQYVNPFIGTSGYGNTFPGATLPFGMMQWSPDTTANGFYTYGSSLIRGFSLTHLSGAGCPIYADIPFLPTVKALKDSPATSLIDYTSAFSHIDEQAAPGYYSVKMNSGVDVKLSTTTRTGFGVFSYPSSEEAHLIINAGGSAKGNSHSAVQIVGDSQVIGSATSGGFCGSNTSYTIYFAAQFDQPITSFSTWNPVSVTPGTRASYGQQAGAFVTFNTTQSHTVKIKVGISFVSVENALLNLKTENGGWDFDAVRRAAAARWNGWLSRIKVEGGTREQREIFYTALYHALISPNVFTDVNGEYIGFDHMVHRASGYTHYTNISDWDTYRTLIQLQALIAPRETSDMMQSLVVDAEQSGWLPKWPLANEATDIMGGDNPVALIATAYAFGAKHFAARAALRYMLKAATQPGMGRHGYTERPRLSEYLKRGYVPLYSFGLDQGIVGSASLTLEYANDDFAIARFARSLGDGATQQSFMRRAQNWQNLFDAEIGFIRPRRPSGVFLEGFAPAALTPHSEVPWDKNNQAGFQEGSTWQYTWMVPFNYQGLFRSIGDNAEVIRRLDKFFTELVGWGRPYFNIANEPSFVSPYAYSFAGAPWRTQKVIRRIMTETFNSTPAGLPGNDDLGATSAWYIWSAIGLYPAIPGVGGFIVSSPSFTTVTIRLGDGRQIRLATQASSSNSLYILNLKLNGNTFPHSWLPLESIRARAITLDFKLSDLPNTTWASDPSNAPPSFTAEQAPAIPFISGSDSLTVQNGATVTLSFGIKKIISTPLKVKWNSSAPIGVSLKPASGRVTINSNESPAVGLRIVVSRQMDTGSYTIPLSFQVISPRTQKGRMLPEAILEIKINSAVKGNVAKINPGN